tara:strand:- start:23 stop:1597 length:1575 start_codon:yes stop_codon:yes gene_type:complete
VATRKISDLTLLNSGEVSSSDTLLLLDNSDPTDQNKRSAVGSIFKAVPSGTYSTPGVQFEGKTATGLFSETQGQVGLSMGDARLNLQKVGTTLNIQARDAADTNLDFTISAQGTGVIRLGSVLAITDTLFVIPNSSDNTKVARFSTADVPTGVTHTYVLPSNGAVAAADTLVTLGATQTLTNKTLSNATFTGTLAVDTISITGNTTIGNESADSLTVNSAATFAASATFSNTVIMQQTLDVTSDITANGKITVTTGLEPETDNGAYLGSNSKSWSSLFVDNIGVDGNTVSALSGDLTLDSVSGKTEIKHSGTTHLETTATGISIGGAIDAVTSITGSGDITIATDKFTLDASNGNAVFGGTITGGGDVTSTAGTAFQFGSSASAKLGVGRAAATYNLEVEGSIYSTGSTFIAGNGTAGKFILQKGVAGIGLHFTDNTGTDQAVLDASGNFGIGKSPTAKFEVSGNSNIDGDLSITTTNPANQTGGKITAREIVLTDPQTNASVTLDSTTGGGVTRGKAFFYSSF